MYCWIRFISIFFFFTTVLLRLKAIISDRPAYQKEISGLDEQQDNALPRPSPSAHTCRHPYWFNKLVTGSRMGGPDWNVPFKKPLWVYCPGHFGVNGNDREDRLAGKATLTSGFLLGRSEVLRSLRHCLVCKHADIVFPVLTIFYTGETKERKH